MMPRIEAGERLAAITDRAAAAGNLKQTDSARLMRRLEEARHGARRRPAKATPAALAGMGIGVRSTPADERLSPVSGTGQTDDG